MRISVYVLALIFFASGMAKLLSLQFEVDAFARWQYPIYFMYLVGVVEIIGAIGLLIPRFSALASLCLAGFMLGAVGTHFVHREWVMLVVASVIALVALWQGWSGRDVVAQLFSRGKPK
uniref:DoxX family protein n=1 Tax=Microbulbifer agarilyticus TaxID=260552 RepID=UPI000255B68D|nr:DoxX family protein [Microbulbifer agarilyticus]